MDYRRLGKTGLRVSELCMGTMQFGWTADEETSYQILSASYEQGVNFLDTANIYSSWVDGNPGGVSEEIIGRWMHKNNISRDQIVLATKVRGTMGEGPNDSGLSRGHIMQAVEDSLRRLKTDYIDIYQTHWPDDETPIEETLEALTDLVRQGKVRYLGCSNYPAWKLMQSLWESDRRDLFRFEVIQPHYNIAKRAEFERELAAVCSKYGIGVIPYSPLAGGFLTGKYRKQDRVPASSRATGVQRRYFNENGWAILDAIEDIANIRNASISQIALAWLLSNDVITSPIIGPRSMEQTEDNLGAAGMRLSASEMEALNEVSNFD